MKKQIPQEGKKELKKQRRGLAQISLKVKNIVAKKGKMSFKEVSDEVLEESKDDLPQDPEYSCFNQDKERNKQKT